MKNGKLRFLCKDHTCVASVADDAGAADNADDADADGAAARAHARARTGGALVRW